MPPTSHWCLGLIPYIGGPDFRTSLQKTTRDYCNENGQTGYWLASQKVIAVTDYQDARAILNGSNHRKPIPLFRRHVDRFLGPRNIGVLTGKEWKFHRNTIVRAFSPSMVDDARLAILKVTSNIISSLKAIDCNNKSFIPSQDIGALMKMITMDVFGQTALSQNLGCCSKLVLSPMATAFDFMNQEMTKRLFNPVSIANQLYWIPTERNVRQQQERKVVRSFLEGLVRKRIAMTESERPQDLLTQLLRSFEDDIKKRKDSVSEEDLSETAISDILMALLFAGYDTTSITLTYALYHIATIPEVEKKCLHEVVSVDLTDPDALQYCRAVVLETLRLYPPGSATTRAVQKPIKLKGGFMVPEGTLCFVPIWIIQRMEQHFEKPNEFHPERWVHQDSAGVWSDRPDQHNSAKDNTENYIAAANRKAFFAFSGGGRSCAAMNFAMTEAVLVLSQLVKHLSFDLSSKDYELCPIRAGLVQCPRDKMLMTMKWRD